MSHLITALEKFNAIGGMKLLESNFDNITCFEIEEKSNDTIIIRDTSTIHLETPIAFTLDSDNDYIYFTAYLKEGEYGNECLNDAINDIYTIESIFSRLE